MTPHHYSLVDLVAPSVWATWLTVHAMQVHSVLQDIALAAAIFASVAAGLYHGARWLRELREPHDKQSKD